MLTFCVTHTHINANTHTYTHTHIITHKSTRKAKSPYSVEGKQGTLGCWHEGQSHLKMMCSSLSAFHDPQKTDLGQRLYCTDNKTKAKQVQRIQSTSHNVSSWAFECFLKEHVAFFLNDSFFLLIHGTILFWSP